jgi:hypothetical protein
MIGKSNQIINFIFGDRTMKKMLMLVLILVIAPFASAVLYTASSPGPMQIMITFTDPTPSQTLDVYIDWTPLRGVVPVMDVNAATLTPINASIANLFVYHTYIPDQGFDWYYLALANMANWTNPTDVATLDLNGAGANTGSTKVTLQLYDDQAVKCGTIDVMVPEPMTIGILCLGSLFLRRRK